MTDITTASDFSVRLGIFAKPPIPNQVKTRLIPDIGAENATRVYRQCLSHALSIASQSGLSHYCFLTEETADTVFMNIVKRLQAGTDLGERMMSAFSEMLTEADAAIIIGTDCLDMTIEHLQGAAQQLQSHDIVIQPVLDGGYSLIGCRQHDPRLFDGVEWSTGDVLQRTLANAAQLGYSVSLLEKVRDIDTLADLQHYTQLQSLISP